MKLSFFLLVVALFCLHQTSGAQTNVEDDSVYNTVEEQASYKGGMNAFYELIAKNVKYPSQAKRMGIDGKIFIEFIINIDGTLSDIKVIKGGEDGLEEEIVRVMALADGWIPGKQNGNAVRTRFIIPINICLR